MVADREEFRSEIKWPGDKLLKSAWHLLFDQTPGDPEKPTFIHGVTGEAILWKELPDLSRRMAYGLLNRVKLQQGEVVLFFAESSLAYPVLVYACLAAKLTCTFANFAYTQEELLHLAQDSKPTCIVTDPQRLQFAANVAKSCGIPPSRVLLLNESDKSIGEQPNVWSCYGKEALDVTHFSPAQAKRTVAFRCYSSGTTGKSKGVNISHANVCASMWQLRLGLPEIYHSNHRWICFLPFFHISGVSTFLMNGPFLNITIIIVPKFDFPQYLKLVEKYKATMMHIVPPIAALLAKSELVPRHDFSSVMTLISGAAPMGKELQAQVETRIGAPLVQAHGMTEAAVISTDSPLKRSQGSNGRIVPGMIGKFVDKELWVTGDNVTMGYHDNPQANAEAFEVDDKGIRWLKTGDIGYLDDYGRIFINDRLKELIKFKGFQVAPAELEDLLVSRDDIADAGVVPVFRETDYTEVPKAYIVLKQGVNANESLANEIISWLAGRTTHHKKLRGGVSFLEALPRNPSGKILRRTLKDRRGDPTFGAEDLSQRSKL